MPPNVIRVKTRKIEGESMIPISLKNNGLSKVLGRISALGLIGLVVIARHHVQVAVAVEVRELDAAVDGPAAG